MMKRRHRFFSGGAVQLLMPLLIILVILFFLAALHNLDAGREEQAIAQLEEALRRAAVACYAAEGMYPPDLEYLEEHYGVVIDEEWYQVHYQVFGSNLMPEITVLKKDR